MPNRRPAVRCTRLVYETPWMRLREDELVYPDGHEAIYSVLERPDFATVVALDGAHAHLVEQWRHPVGEVTLEFPQGALDPGDDPLACARRELREETGLRADAWEALGVVLHAAGHSTMRQHIFVATGLAAGPPQRAASEADLRVRRIALEELPAMVADGRLRESSALCAWARLESRRGQGSSWARAAASRS